MGRVRKIYTRTGDKGTTSIHGRIRVPKTDIRIETNGTIDELNVSIGIVRSLLDKEHKWQKPLMEIQLTLMSVMSLVATKADMRASNPNRLPDDLITNIEQLIDEISSETSVPQHFILPGGNRISAFIHQARVVARRAERRLWELDEKDTVPEVILIYMNRLSDLFFTMARLELQNENINEERWKTFAYRREL